MVDPGEEIRVRLKMAVTICLRRKINHRKYGAYLLLSFSLFSVLYLCITHNTLIECEIENTILEREGQQGLASLPIANRQHTGMVLGNDSKEIYEVIRTQGDVFNGLRGKLRGILRHGGPGSLDNPQGNDYYTNGIGENEHNKGTDTNILSRSTIKKPGPYPADKTAESKGADKHRIPRIIHQTWEDLAIPGQVKHWVQSWRTNHPDWEYWFWTDRGSRHMIHDNFPTSVLSTYADYPYNINRADVRKLLVLYQYGGVFADLDVESLLPLDDLLSKYQCIIAQEPLEHQALLYEYKHSRYVMTAFMACRPKHPFLKFVIDALPQYANRALTLDWNDNVLKSTGPMFLSEVLDQYLNNSSYTGSTEEYVYIAPPQWFMPTFDSINMDTYVQKCSNISAVPSKQKGVCKRLMANDFKNTPIVGAFTNHHWLHSWGYGFVPKGHVSIEQVVNNFTKLDS